MKSSALIQQIGIALLLTCLAAINDSLLSHFFSSLLSIKLNLSLIALFYLGYLIRQNRLAAGRITLFTVDFGLVLICLITEAHLSTLLWLYPAMIWVNRSLLRYASLLVVFADLGLCLIGAGAVLWVLSTGHGVISALWCFLLLQGLHVMIPGQKSANKAEPAMPASDNFNRALQSAENALQQLLRKESAR